MIMPTNLLETCRACLEQAYHDKMGLRFCTTASEVDHGREPYWRFVTTSDLLTEAEATASDAAGLLLDPEIGLLLYFLPFDTDDELRKHANRALSVRSRLSIERNYRGAPTELDDMRGSWRIALNWLVPHALRKKWIEQIAHIRSETGFSEELSFDCLFYQEGALDKALNDRAFPRLLLATREIFRKRRPEELDQWRSADEHVRRALDDFQSLFRDSEQRKLANSVVESMHSYTPGKAERSIERRPDVHHLRISDFRNLGDIQLDFGDSPVSANVIHGPNGTGKSSIVEAISLALFHTSTRHQQFANLKTERDVTATNRQQEYVREYLTPLDRPNAQPRIGLNSADPIPVQLVTGESVEAVEGLLSGSILTQEVAAEFAQLSGEALGARILRGYSDLADHIEAFTDNMVSEVNAARQKFLRELGLSVSITKVETALCKVARRALDKFMPALPGPLVTWLQQYGEVVADSNSSKLVHRWRAWGEDSSRDSFAKLLAKYSKDPEQLGAQTREWLAEYNDLVLLTLELRKSIDQRVASHQSDFSNFAASVRAWAKWLQIPSSLRSEQESTDAQRVSSELRILEERQQSVLNKGKALARHVEHLTQVEAFVRDSWVNDHPSDCPTCGSDLANSGGVVEAVAKLRTTVSRERDSLREAYKAIAKELEVARSNAAHLVIATCPIHDAEQAKLRDAFQWLLPPGTDFAEWISRPERCDLVLRVTELLQNLPPVPARVNVEALSEESTTSLRALFRNAEHIFAAPGHWKPVKDRLTTVLGEIVAEHLPRTIQRVWCELVMNLTTASWLLPQQPALSVESRPGARRTTVRVRNKLARYILNQSEIHVLGLAWFFVTYLTRGRFFSSCVVLDDPAHELDQTSFRELCRLLETFVRLHRVYSVPLKLVLLLNQETRAVDAARATQGLLTLLRWSGVQESLTLGINPIGDGFYAPQASVLFEARAQ